MSYIISVQPLPQNPFVRKLTEVNGKMIRLGYAKKYYDRVILGRTRDEQLIQKIFFTPMGLENIFQGAIKDTYKMDLNEVQNFKLIDDINVFILKNGCSLAVKSSFFDNVTKRMSLEGCQIAPRTFFLMLGRSKELWSEHEILQLKNNLTDHPESFRMDFNYSPNQWAISVCREENPEINIIHIPLHESIAMLYITMMAEEGIKKGNFIPNPTRPFFNDL